MTNEELMQLKDGDRVIVRYSYREVPGTVSGSPTDSSVGVTLDAGLGFNGAGQAVHFAADEIVRRAEPGEGLLRIGDAFYPQSATILAEET